MELIQAECGVCVCGGGGGGGGVGGSPNTRISLPMNYTVFDRVARGVVQGHLLDGVNILPPLHLGMHWFHQPLSHTSDQIYTFCTLRNERAYGSTIMILTKSLKI